jgi:hypothetical protein
MDTASTIRPRCWPEVEHCVRSALHDASATAEEALFPAARGPGRTDSCRWSFPPSRPEVASLDGREPTMPFFLDRTRRPTMTTLPRVVESALVFSSEGSDPSPSRAGSDGARGASRT